MARFVPLLVVLSLISLSLFSGIALSKKGSKLIETLDAHEPSADHLEFLDSSKHTSSRSASASLRRDSDAHSDELGHIDFESESYGDLIYDLPTPTGIANWGGRVLSGDENGHLPIHVIYVGEWDDEELTLVRHFLNFFDLSERWAIIKQYYQLDTLPSRHWWSSNTRWRVTGHAPKTMSIASELFYSLRQDEIFPPWHVRSLIVKAVIDDMIEIDEEALYLVLVGKNVVMRVPPWWSVPNADSKDYTCAESCGFYNGMKVDGSNIQVAFTFDHSYCLDECAPQTFNSPNKLPGIDGMVNTLMGMIAGLITDPSGLTWHIPGDNFDMAAMCQNDFGSEDAGQSLDETSRDSGEANHDWLLGWHNEEFAGRRWLLQRLLALGPWKADSPGCSAGPAYPDDEVPGRINWGNHNLNK